MVGANCLEGTPQTMADMHGCDNHGQDIDDNI